MADGIFSQIFGAAVGDVSGAVFTGLATVLTLYVAAKVITTPGALASIVTVWSAMIKMVTDVTTSVIGLFREKL